MRNFRKYRLVYTALWQTFGQQKEEQLSFFLQFSIRLCKLIALPIATSLIITRLSVKDFAGAQQAVLLFIFFSLLIGMLSPITKYVAILGENRAYRIILLDYFSRLLAADIDYFHSNLSGYLTTATRQYVDSCMILSRNIRDKYMGTLLSIFFPIGVIFWIDRTLGIITIVLSIIQATYLFWATHVITPYRSKSRELYKYNSGRIADIIANILAVKAAAKEEVCLAEREKGAYEENEVYRIRYAMQAKLIALREVITVSFFFILLLLTIQRMSTQTIDLTSAILIVTYATTILTGIYLLSDDLDDHDDLIDKIIPAFDILQRKNAITDPEKPHAFTNIRGEIIFNDVSFAYQDGQNVLEHFSLHIPSSQKVGVVGLSGTGKSTLTKLLLRFNDVTDGEVLIDGINVKDVLQRDLRTQIAYVPQEPLLFHATVKENILFARPDATDEHIIKALHTAHAWEFVKDLPETINSIVGERGVKLSGGQKQRIAIARAILQQTPIMILDEATSALDSESERIIKSSFKDILRNRTAIVVAHRLSTLSEMDRIIVIEKGKLREDGTHTTLMKQKGVYAKLWKYQQHHTD